MQQTWYEIAPDQWMQAIDLALIATGDISQSCNHNSSAEAWVIPHAASPPTPLEDAFSGCVIISGIVSAGLLASGSYPSHETAINATIECQNLDFSWLGKIGCWIDALSIGTTLAFNPSINYFLCVATLIDQVEALCGSRPIVLASDSHNAGALISKMIEYADRIAAVIWDYECDLGEQVMIDVHDAANALGVPLGISTSSSPSDATALTYQGFIHEDAAHFCDFVCPQYYSQWWSNNASVIKSMYDVVCADTPVPVVPMITTEVTTSNPAIARFNPLSPATISSVYGPMGIEKLICWNVKNTDASQWASIEGILI
jgi:hypothetical protein